MRVATVFMGAATCAMAGATAANAGIAGATAAKTHDAAGANAGFVRVAGSIREITQCAQHGGQSHWLHVASLGYISYCYGYKGAGDPLSETGIVAECGGNNYGWLTGWTSGQTRTWGYHYGPGAGYRASSNSSLENVTISKWGGSLKCPAW
jgi:hypothetical protein